MRVLFLLLHRWVGLAFALVIAFVGLSGAALVWAPEIEARLHPQLLRVTPQTAIAQLNQSVAATRRQFPDAKISLFFVAQSPGAAHEIWLDKGQTRVYADPYSGRILGARDENSSFWLWLSRAHTHLLAGEVGEQVLGWMGLVLASLAGSGLILWWPRAKNAWKRAFRPHLRTNWKGRIYELHRAGGFWVCLLLLNSGLTGAALVWPETATRIVAVFGVSSPKKVHVTSAPNAGIDRLVDIDRLVGLANRAFPDGRVTRLGFPSKAGAPFVVRKKLDGELHPNGQNNIALDPATGRVLQITDSRRARRGEALMNLRYPLHIGRWGFGRWGGSFSRIIAVFGGLSTAFLALSGVAMSWNRWRRRGVPPTTPRLDSAPNSF